MTRILLLCLASLLMSMASTSARAGELGGLYCPDCKIPAPQDISLEQMNAAQAFLTANWPSDFQPNVNDVVDVCNGHRCIRHKYTYAGWIRHMPGTGSVTNTDKWAAANKNYINVKKNADGTGSGAVALMPSAYSDTGGGNWQIFKVGYWNFVTMVREGVVIGTASFYTMESLYFTFTPFDPNPREDMPMGTTPPPGEEF